MPLCDFADAVARLREAADAGVIVADEPTGKALLRGIGVATPESRVVGTADEAAAAAADLDGPVGLKIVAPRLAHKSDVGGVIGPLQSAEHVGRAAADMLARLDGELLVEAWETSGVHCFVGLSLGGPLGPVVSVGLGGIWVEVLRDVAYRAAPVTADEAAEALSTLRGAALLEGGRGRTPVDVKALAEAVARISRLVLEPELGEIVSEIDVNPLLARLSGAPVALDCTIVFAGRAQPSAEPALVAGVAS